MYFNLKWMLYHYPNHEVLYCLPRSATLNHSFKLGLVLSKSAFWTKYIHIHIHDCYLLLGKANQSPAILNAHITCLWLRRKLIKYWIALPISYFTHSLVTVSDFFQKPAQKAPEPGKCNRTVFLYCFVRTN